MLKLTVRQILQKIEHEEIFEATSSDYSFTLKIDSYVPYVCAAIHDGHQFRKELWDYCSHSEYDRWYEEDPMTLQMIQHQPIVLAGRDSRFEYDLNRDPENAIFETAWDKVLWKKPLTGAMKDRSLKKHADFYTVTSALIKKLETKFSHCIVYDIHSYNWKRWDREVPTFNLGIANIDVTRFGVSIEQWRSLLSEVNLPNNLNNGADCNNTFFGHGYFLKFITKSFKNTLVLATEVKKIYCDELTQTIYPEVVKSLEINFDKIIKQHVDFYLNEMQS
jgi:hypothetical protein